MTLTIKSAASGGSLASNRIGGREVEVWSVLIVAVAFWANILRGSDPGDMPGFDDMVARVLENGAFDVFAWSLIFARVADMSEPRPAAWPRVVATFLIGGVALAPVRLAAGIALAVLGWLLLRDRRALPAGRQVGTVMLALAFETVWTSRLAAPLHVAAGRLDAHICAFLLRLLGMDASAHGNVVDNASTNFSISLWPYCTSSFPLAGVGLAFLVMCLYLGRQPRWRHVPWLVTAFMAGIVLTEIRLVLLATSEANYFWWHAGPGVSIYAMAALGLAVVFPILATRDHHVAPILSDTTVSPGNRPAV